MFHLAFFSLLSVVAVHAQIAVKADLLYPMTGDLENMTFTLAAQLHKKGIPFAFQSGYEKYVPKTRVVHFEAALAAAYGLPKNIALAACTLYPAQILGLDKKNRLPATRHGCRPRPLRRRSAGDHHAYHPCSH